MSAREHMSVLLVAALWPFVACVSRVTLSSSCRKLAAKIAGNALTLQYLLATFPQQKKILTVPDHSRRHRTPAPWRSSQRKYFSPKASENIVKGSPVSSLLFGTRE